MAYTFGDGLDLYATVADMLVGYWDGGSVTTGNSVFSTTAGRFGGRALQSGNTAVAYVFKNSGSNDAVHHVNIAFQQTVGLSGTSLGFYIQLLDGSTGQCAIVFRSDGTILLTSGSAAGSTLATYSNAFGSAVWNTFEFEVVINNSTGSFTARKNGNTSNDFTATGLNTRGGTANNYANRLQLGNQSNTSPLNANSVHELDDVLWRSDSSVSWVGDVRCWTRMPASDGTVQFSKSPAVTAVTPYSTATTSAFTAGAAKYAAFTATYDGTVGSVSIPLNAGFTGNLKCSLFASSDSSSTSVPTTVLGSATTITNPATGTNTFTFGSPVAVTKNTRYYVGFDPDTSSGSMNVANASANLGGVATVAYASFPTATPGFAGSTFIPVITVNITPSSNTTLVNETQEDTTTSYVYDSTVGHGDLYAIAAVSSTVSSVVAVTTRGYFEKGDAGARGAAMQLWAGTTAVQSTATLLSTSWSWLYRTDTTDPSTGVAWVAGAVDSVQIGPVVTS
jgi:hypothetical protein